MATLPLADNGTLPGNGTLPDDGLLHRPWRRFVLTGGWVAGLSACLMTGASVLADGAPTETDPAERPATAARQPLISATQPAASSRQGVVQEALTELYARPRVRSPHSAQETRVLNRPTATRSAISAQTPGENHGRVPPHPGVSSDHRLGLQHLDAIRNSAIRSVPIGDDIHGAQARRDPAPGEPDETESRQPSANTYIFITPPPAGYGYQAAPRLTQRERSWANYRYFGGNPSRYGHGRFDRYRGTAPDDGDAFRYGFLRGYDVGRFEQTAHARTHSLLAYARAELNRGIELFAQGRYDEAADAFQVSVDSDHGDATARIYAGHALFALGRYRDAAVHIRRAIELQPRIVHLRYDMRGDYGRLEDFDGHLRALEEALAQAPTDPDRLFLLGYVQYFSGPRSAAYPVLARAHALHRNDTLVARMMRNAQPSDVERDAMKADPPGPQR